MALAQILSPRAQVTNAQGNPLAGGKVFLFEPGTTTPVTSFSDSGLVTANNHPVRLSGSGRASIWVSRDVDVFITDRNSGDVIPTNIVASESNANPDRFGQNESGGLVVNGSFENDADADDVPDNWVETADAGSSNGIDTSESTDGAQSFRFTSSGTGGGQLETADFFPVNDVDNLRVNVDLRSTVAGVRNIIRVRWFDVSQVFLSASDAYDSTSNPTSFTSQQLSVAPPANARFAKLVLIGCDPSVATPGSTFFDRVQVFYPAVVSGAFDNLLLADNTVSATNTNGEVQLQPDGTGAVILTSDGGLTDAVRTTPTGMQVRASSGDTTVALQASGGAARAQLIAGASGNLELQNDGAGDVIIDATGGSVVLTEQNGFAMQTTPTGLEVRAQAGETDVDILFRDSAAADRFSLSTNAFDSLTLQNENNSGVVRLRGTTSGGSTALLVQGDPDGQAELYFNNAKTFATTVTGAEVRTSATTTTLGMADSSGTPRAQMFAFASGQFRIDNIQAGDIQLRPSSGSVSLFNDNSTVLSTTTRGCSLRDPSGSNPRLDLENNTGDSLARLTFATGDVQLRPIENNSGVELYVDDGGSAELAFKALEGGAVRLFHDASIAFETTASGIFARDTSGAAPRFDLQDDGGTRVGALKVEVSGALTIENPNAQVRLENAGAVQLATQQNNAAGNTSGATVIDHTGTGRDVGFNDVRAINSNASVTLQDEHAGGVINYSNSTAYTVTVPSDTTVFPAGSQCDVENYGSATITLSAPGSLNFYLLDGTGTPSGTGSLSLAPGGAVTIRRKGNLRYNVFGTGVS